MNLHVASTRDLVDHVAAVLTPPGRGAIASIGIHGPRACQAVMRWFQPASGRPLDQYASGHIVFGLWRSAGDTTPGEQLVVQCSGSDKVEVHCHGGRAAVANILDSLRDAGCRITDPISWLYDQHTDRLVIEAHRALSQARTFRTAAILLDQWNGALSNAVRAARNGIAAGETTEATSKITQLIDAAAVGLHVLNPWRIVVTGRPNAGKSTLVNALLGYARSIVHERPGTTRDVLTAEAALDGWPVEIVDTAGLHTTRDELESAGIERAKQQFGSADLLVWVHDSVQPWHADDVCWLTDQRSRMILVHNKSDLASPVPNQCPAGTRVSAQQGCGMPELLNELTGKLVARPPAPGAAVPFLERHVDLLDRALTELSSERHAAALAELDRLVSTERPSPASHD
jgi:tRNA modification GTPase